MKTGLSFLDDDNGGMVSRGPACMWSPSSFVSCPTLQSDNNPSFRIFLEGTKGNQKFQDRGAHMQVPLRVRNASAFAASTPRGALWFAQSGGCGWAALELHFATISLEDRDKRGCCRTERLVDIDGSKDCHFGHLKSSPCQIEPFTIRHHIAQSGQVLGYVRRRSRGLRVTMPTELEEV
jgi:hypothetical protein